MSTLGDRNYFELFGLPLDYDIESASLSARYHDLQRKFHPDRYAQSSDAERRASIQLVTLINEAYATLKDPLRRGQYMLELAGIDIGSENNTAMTPEFLMAQMEMRETMDEIRKSMERSRLDQLIDDLEVARDSRIERVRLALAKGDELALADGRDAVRELQFLDKLVRETGALEAALDD